MSPPTKLRIRTIEINKSIQNVEEYGIGADPNTDEGPAGAPGNVHPAIGHAEKDEAPTTGDKNIRRRPQIFYYRNSPRQGIAGSEHNQTGAREHLTPTNRRHVRAQQEVARDEPDQAACDSGAVW